MRKFLLTIMLLFATNISTMLADDPVILHPINNGESTGNPDVPRTPIVLPDVYIDGYSLYFDGSCIGCSITLLDEDESIVFMDVVNENGIVNIPNNLTGTFELQLVRGDITYSGEIEL